MRREHVPIAIDRDPDITFVLSGPLIADLARLAASDLHLSHDAIRLLASDEYEQADCATLERIEEQHTRAITAVRALIALLDPDERIAAHIGRAGPGG